MSRIVDIEPLLHKYDGMNEGTEFSPIHFINDLMALEQQQQLCEDCISRIEALKVIEEQKKGFYGAERYAIDECHSAVMKLPSVIPKWKVGKWIKTYEPNDAEPFILWECSKCQNAERGKRTKYCPNCGSKMEVEDENKTK